jgi:hypothetical protein
MCFNFLYNFCLKIFSFQEEFSDIVQGYIKLFISPSGISDLCGTVTGMVTPKGSMLTDGEILQFSVLPYRCSICPPLVTRQMSNLAILADSITQNASLFPVHAMFRHDCPLTVKPAIMQWNLGGKKTWRDSAPIDMFLSAVSVLVVVQLSSEVPEGLMNNPVLSLTYKGVQVKFPL